MSRSEAGGEGASAFPPHSDRGAGSDTLRPGEPVDLAAAGLVALVVEKSAEPELIQLTGSLQLPGPCFINDGKLVFFFKAGDNPPLYRPGFAYFTSGVVNTPPAGGWLVGCEPDRHPVTPLPAWAYDPEGIPLHPDAEAPPTNEPSRNGENLSTSGSFSGPAIDNKVVKTPTSRWPAPVLVSELSDAVSSVEWLWNGCVARRHVTLCSAIMKSGKSTLVGHLLRSLQDGSPFAGRQTQKCRTLVVSEESQAIWRVRRDALGLDDSLAVMCRPMLVKPTFSDWVDFLAHVRTCAAGKFDLVVIDTLSAFAPWENENSAADVQATLTPLNQLTNAGLAVLAIHHIGKLDGSEGRAARGSTALAAGVDILLEMRRFKPDDRQDRRRVLTGLGRFDEVPDELVIALAEDGSGYTAEGDRKGIAAREVQALIMGVLPLDPPGWTVDEVHGELPEDGRPKRGEVSKALQAGAEAGSWWMSGAGKPYDPRRFWRK
jgi:hypothetical protein